MIEVVNFLLTISLALLIYSWFKRKSATVYLLRVCLVATILITTPCLAGEGELYGLPGIPGSSDDNPIIILGVHGEYTSSPYGEQSMWLEGIEAFLNGTLSNSFANNTTIVA